MKLYKEETSNISPYEKNQTYIFEHPTNLTFLFSIEINHEVLAKSIFIQYLSFSFGEKFSFIYYCQETLNFIANLVSQTTRHFMQKKKKIIKYFLSF